MYIAVASIYLLFCVNIKIGPAPINVGVYVEGV